LGRVADESSPERLGWAIEKERESAARLLKRFRRTLERAADQAGGRGRKPLVAFLAAAAAAYLLSRALKPR